MAANSPSGKPPAELAIPRPGEITREADRLIAEQLPPHRRMDPVAADQHVAVFSRTIGEACRDPCRILFEADAFPAGSDRVAIPVAHRFEQDALQCRAMNADRRRSGLHGQHGEIEIPSRAAVGETCPRPVDDGSGRQHRQFDPETPQRDYGIRPQRQPGTDLRACAAFSYTTASKPTHRNATAAGQPADAAADNQRAQGSAAITPPPTFAGRDPGQSALPGLAPAHRP